MSENGAGSKVSFFIVGMGIGALVGLLFAPKSGEETREYLTGKADDGREFAQKKARELRERAEDLLERRLKSERGLRANSYGPQILGMVFAEDDLGFLEPLGRNRHAV